MTERKVQWTPRPEPSPKREPLPPLPNRLSWVLYKHEANRKAGDCSSASQTYWWPAILHTSIDEYIGHNGRDHVTQLALDVMDNYDTKFMIAQYLGLGRGSSSSKNYTLLKQGTDYYTYTDMLQHAMFTLSQPKAFSENLDLYPDFMRALDEAYDILKNDGTKSNKQFNRGQELLAAYQGSRAASKESVATMVVTENPRIAETPRLEASKVAEVDTPRVNKSIMEDIQAAAKAEASATPPTISTPVLDSKETEDNTATDETEDSYGALRPETEDAAMLEEEDPANKSLDTEVRGEQFAMLEAEDSHNPEKNDPTAPTELKDSAMREAEVEMEAKDSSTSETKDSRDKELHSSPSATIISASEDSELPSRQDAIDDDPAVKANAAKPATTERPNNRTMITTTMMDSAGSASTALEDEVMVKESNATSTTTTHFSSSATVVSEAGSEQERDDYLSNSPVEKEHKDEDAITSVDIHSLKPVVVNKTDSFQKAFCDMVFSGWRQGKPVNERHTVYYPPGESSAYLDEVQVREYLKLRCGWEGDDKLETLDKEALDRNPKAVTPEAAEKEVVPKKGPGRKRKLGMDSKPSLSQEKKRATKRKQAGILIQVPPSRTSSRRSQDLSGSIAKKMKGDEFYNFNSLMQFNKACLNWRYLSGGQFHPWKYVVGDGAGPKGKEGIDFFHSEDEVVKYCIGKKYKERYHKEYKKWAQGK